MARVPICSGTSRSIPGDLIGYVERNPSYLRNAKRQVHSFWSTHFASDGESAEIQFERHQIDQIAEVTRENEHCADWRRLSIMAGENSGHIQQKRTV
jgi:hypothetical protein